MEALIHLLFSISTIHHGRNFWVMKKILSHWNIIVFENYWKILVEDVDPKFKIIFCLLIKLLLFFFLIAAFILLKI